MSHIGAHMRTTGLDPNRGRAAFVAIEAAQQQQRNCTYSKRIPPL